MLRQSKWAWDNVPDLKIYYGDTEEARNQPERIDGNVFR
jgi:hypothetical protein